MEIIVIDFTWGLVIGLVAGAWIGSLIMALVAFGKSNCQHSATCSKADR